MKKTKQYKINYPNKILVVDKNLLDIDRKKKYFGLAYRDEAKIEIDPYQVPNEYLDSLLHECIHILFPDMEEEEVYKLGLFLSGFLWENGYRKIYQENKYTNFDVTPNGASPSAKKIKGTKKMSTTPPLISSSFPKLKEEYSLMFSNIKIRDIALVKKTVDEIIKNKEIYQKVGIAPWYWIGCIHYRESTLNFNKHLHNGDSLKKRTVNEPSGRPLSEPTTIGGYAWEVSAKDALQLKQLNKWTDWSIEGLLYQAERYNGFGYRLYKSNNSPYLWSGTDNWKSGKYLQDGKYSATATKDQLGVAPLLFEMKSRNIFS
jgi:lysozyme family protein